jgi:Phage tail lysozyme
MAFHTVGSIGGKIGVNALNIPGTSSRLSGVSVAMLAVGGIILWSGIKGATLSDTLKGVLSGSPQNVSDTETVDFGSNGTAGSASNATSSSGSANYLTIARYLVSNGYSNAGAAGVVACVAGESGGNPEAKEAGGTGVGLIQWSGSNAQDVTLTGNATADLDSQLPAIIAYNNAQGSGLVQMLNAMTNPIQAADFYSQNFERPAVQDSDVVASVATSVFNELQGSVPAPTPSGSQSLNLGEL